MYVIFSCTKYSKIPNASTKFYLHLLQLINVMYNCTISIFNFFFFFSKFVFLHCCNIYLHIYIALLSETTKLTLFFYTPIFQASEQGRACLPLSPWLLLLPLLTSIVANYVRNNGWKYDVSSSDFQFCCCRDHDSLLHLAPSALSR